MNDDDMLATMRNSLGVIKESLSDVHMIQPVSAITGRARNRRLRRGLSGAGAGAVALGVGLTFAFSPGAPAGPRAVHGSAVHVNLAAWSVNTLPSGIIDVTIRELEDPALLRKVLAEAGLPALITFNESCYAPIGGDLRNIGEVLGQQNVNGEVQLTIDPAAMPAGSELSIAMIYAGHTVGVTSFTLIKSGTALTCTPQSASTETPTGTSTPLAP